MQSTNWIRKLTAVAASGSAASRTFTVQLDGRAKKVILQVWASTPSTATGIRVTPSISLDGIQFTQLTHQQVLGATDMSEQVVDVLKTHLFTFASSQDGVTITENVDGIHTLKILVDATGTVGSAKLDCIIGIVRE